MIYFLKIFTPYLKPLTKSYKIQFTILSYLFIFTGVILSVTLIQVTDYFITSYLEFPSIKVLFHQSRIRIDRFGIFKIAILVPLIEEIIDYCIYLTFWFGSYK